MISLENRAFWALTKTDDGYFYRPFFPFLRTVDGHLVHSAKDKAELLGNMFTPNSDLDDQGTTPSTVSRRSSSMSEVHFT